MLRINKIKVVKVFFDLKTAFNTVDYNPLINKLENYGIRGVTKECFRSYLKNRKQFVSSDGIASNTKHISTGVSQWSVLGPLLILIYINDLCTSVK